MYNILIIVGRRSIRHEGYKVSTQRQSIQGHWESNLFNSYPRHGILEFKQLPADPLKLEDIGAVKPNVKKNLKKTYAMRLRKTPAIELF
jgi:hypothetical protein